MNLVNFSRARGRMRTATDWPAQVDVRIDVDQRGNSCVALRGAPPNGVSRLPAANQIGSTTFSGSVNAPGYYFSQPGLYQLLAVSAIVTPAGGATGPYCVTLARAQISGSIGGLGNPQCATLQPGLEDFIPTMGSISGTLQNYSVGKSNRIVGTAVSCFFAPLPQPILRGGFFIDGTTYTADVFFPVLITTATLNISADVSLIYTRLGGGGVT